MSYKPGYAGEDDLEIIDGVLRYTGKTKSAAYDPNQPRDENGMWTDSELQAIKAAVIDKPLNTLSNTDSFDLARKTTDPKVLKQLAKHPYRYTRNEVANKLAPIDLHQMLNDPDIDVRRTVADRIDQSGLQKMVNDPDMYVRMNVAERINQEGLQKLALDRDTNVLTIVANRADKTGLETIKNRKDFEYIASDIQMKTERRLKTMELIGSVVSDYDRTGKMVLNDNLKARIKTIASEGGESKEIIGLTDEIYKMVKDGKYATIHSDTKMAWERSSSSNEALLLKDSIKRQYGGEIRYHDEVKDINEKLKELHEFYPQDTVDEYVRTQKDLTRAFLDEMYPNTKEITIFRGTTEDEVNMIDFDPESSVNEAMAKSNSLSSWTLKKDVADKFARNNEGLVLSAEVSKDDVWSTFMSHAYHGNEREILVIGKDRKVDISYPSDYPGESGASAEFDESEHPRKEDGEFTFKGEGITIPAVSKPLPEKPLKKLRRIKATMGNRYKLSAVGENEMLNHMGKSCCQDANTDLHWNFPVDMVDNKLKIGYEVKTFSKDAKDIKVKTNPEIKARKENWAKETGYMLKTLVVVYDKRAGTTEGYVRDGYGGYRTPNMEKLW